MKKLMECMKKFKLFVSIADVGVRKRNPSSQAGGWSKLIPDQFVCAEIFTTSFSW